MKVVAFGPHTDDSIFSVGAHLAAHDAQLISKLRVREHPWELVR